MLFVRYGSYKKDLLRGHGYDRGMGWGSCDAPEPAYEAGTQRRKDRLNAGTSWHPEGDL